MVTENNPPLIFSRKLNNTNNIDNSNNKIGNNTNNNKPLTCNVWEKVQRFNYITFYVDENLDSSICPICATMKSQPAFTDSNSTIETLKKGSK